ncbi:MAG TPA: prolyl oligopeptidase family serine peptidase [Balneolaceae bacterium]|nr:prolyl oligopeptidase family serine peptidase [Balneolaceae bacterium]
MLLIFPKISNGQNKKLTFDDIMRWKDVSNAVVSDDGNWLAYNVWPDRGDGYVQIRNIDNDTQYTISLGKYPTIAGNSKWVGAYIEPELAKKIKADKDKPKRGLALLNTESGKTIKIDSVKTYRFSNDGRWAAVHIYKNKADGKKTKKNKYSGSEMLLLNLSNGKKYHIPDVREAAIDSASNYIAYAVADSAGTGNGLYYRDLKEKTFRQQKITAQENEVFANLSWNNKKQRLAFTQAPLDTTYQTGNARIKLWNPTKNKVLTLVKPSEIEKGWTLRTNNNLEWSDDGNRLFFGLMPQFIVNIRQRNKKEEKSDSIDIYDRGQILDQKKLDIWSYKDTLIKPNAKKIWNRRKNQTYRAVYHTAKENWIQLADKQMPKIKVNQNNEVALGYSNVPYLSERAWNRTLRDYYVVNLKTGKRKRVAKRLRYSAKLSPDGKYVLFYKDQEWHLYNIKKDLYRNLTGNIKEPFYNVEFSRPSSPPPYGVGGWIRGDKEVLIYGRYNIWKFSTDKNEAVNLTEDGKERNIQYRIVQTEPNRHFFEPDEKILLRGFYHHKKTYGFYTLELDETGTDQRLETKHKYNFIAKADSSDRFIYTRESYDEYPNIWVSNGMNFDETHRITDFHLHLHDKYNWGHAELISWTNLEGQELQGALIKPDDYDNDKKYPMIVYFYAGSFSNRAYEFNNITNDDRPTLPQYASNGYLVFLPDIKFTVGSPGFSSTKSLLPGVLKLIESGIVDKDKIGLHGHSWGGYQTAFIVTQTDLFSAAVAGAPVANMTSAYSGIRLGSGMARQYQYEKGQSRIGGSLWEYPERYIENSPVFYADRINTPLLIMTGDKDTAVPWYQDIEMFLAMRRLGKKSILLQYNNEPHHLQKYANRLDYAIKMKQYFDYHLLDKGSPKWILKGSPYYGK